MLNRNEGVKIGWLTNDEFLVFNRIKFLFLFNLAQLIKLEGWSEFLPDHVRM
jgi:hypothetical protein